MKRQIENEILRLFILENFDLALLPMKAQTFAWEMT